MAKRVVTYTELKHRRRCPYKAHLEYDKLLAPKINSTGLREGTIADEGMNALYLGVRDTGEYQKDMTFAAMQKAFLREEQRMRASGLDVSWEEVYDSYDLLEALMANYIDYARECDPFDKIVTMQFQGRTPVITTNGYPSSVFDYQFKADGLVVIKDRLWLLENKWFKTVSSQVLAALQMDEQSGMYLWGVRQLIARREAPPILTQAVADYGLPVGVYYNIVRKKLPTVPALLKNGTTSRDKSIDTTLAVYVDTLIERGQNPSDYPDILAALRDRANTFVVREGVFRNARELDEIGGRIYHASRYIAEGWTFKNPTRDCTWECPFWSLCLEWDDNVVEYNFRVKDAAHEEYNESEEAA